MVAELEADDMGHDLSTAVFYGARSTGWAGVRPLADLDLHVHLELPDTGWRKDLFRIFDDAACMFAGVDAPGAGAALSSFGDAAAHLAGFARAARPAIESVEPIGAVQRRVGAPGRGTGMAFVAVTVDADLLFSRTDATPSAEPGEHVWPMELAECERHALARADYDERAPGDLTFVEREIKLDASVDLRPVASRLRLGDGEVVFSGTPTSGVHFHRVYDIGPSGLFEMTSDPQSGQTLLKYKQELAGPDEAVYRRFEVVEPTTPENLRRVAANLDPAADLSSVAVTPYFRRDRVAMKAYVVESRSVFEICADRSTFLDGDYAPFDQIEIEYVGAIDRAGAEITWGLESTPQLDADFALIQALVVEGFARAGVPLTASRRRKYDWAVAEVFSSL